MLKQPWFGPDICTGGPKRTSETRTGAPKRKRHDPNPVLQSSSVSKSASASAGHWLFCLAHE
eukprot:9979752-Alexandrium_andersonii.AAC.1